MRFTKRRVKAGSIPERSERDKFIKGLLDAVNDVYINHQGSLTDTSFQQNTDRLLDAVEENYPEHLAALEHAINNPANPMENEKQKPKWGIIASLLLTDISNDEKSQKEVLNFITKGTSKQKGSVYNYLKEYGVDKLKKIMKNSEQNDGEQPPEPIVEDSEYNSEPEAKEVKKLKPKKKSGGAIARVLEDLIKQQEEISKLDISDEVKLKRLHSIEQDIIKDANLERFIVNFLKAKQELELQLNRPLIFGGAIRKFLTKDEAEAFIKARQKPGVKISATLAHKDDSLDEKIKKIKEEDEKNKVIDKFLKKEVKKGSNQRNQEVITQLASAGYVTKGARSVKTLDKVPEKVVDNKVVGILPEYKKNEDGTSWSIISEYDEDKRYENKFLFALRNYNVPEQVIRFKIPYVNGIINARYVELETLLDRKVDEIIRQSEVDIIENAGIKVKTKMWNDRNVVMVTSDTVFDMIAFDIDRSATKNFEQTETNIKKKVSKAKEEGNVKETIDDLLPDIIASPTGLADLPDDKSKIYATFLQLDDNLKNDIGRYIIDHSLLKMGLKDEKPKSGDINITLGQKDINYKANDFLNSKEVAGDFDKAFVQEVSDNIRLFHKEISENRSAGYKVYGKIIEDEMKKNRTGKNRRSRMDKKIKDFNSAVAEVKKIYNLGINIRDYLADKVRYTEDIPIIKEAEEMKKKLIEYDNMIKNLIKKEYDPVTGLLKKWI